MSLINVRDEKYNAIKNNPAFSKLNYEIIKGIAKSMQIGDYCKNSFVYRENLDKQKFMYIVKSGEFKVRINRKTRDDQKGSTTFPKINNRNYHSLKRGNVRS